MILLCLFFLDHEMRESTGKPLMTPHFIIEIDAVSRHKMDLPPQKPSRSPSDIPGDQDHPFPQHSRHCIEPTHSYRMAASPHPQTQCRFFTALPPELRNPIYDLIFPQAKAGDAFKDLLGPHRPSKAFASTCRQAYAETYELYRAVYCTFWGQRELQLDLRGLHENTALQDRLRCFFEEVRDDDFELAHLTSLNMPGKNSARYDDNLGLWERDKFVSGRPYAYFFFHEDKAKDVQRYLEGQGIRNVSLQTKGNGLECVALFSRDLGGLGKHLMSNAERSSLTKVEILEMVEIVAEMEEHEHGIMLDPLPSRTAMTCSSTI